jgi:hypothetical protein
MELNRKKSKYNQRNKEKLKRNKHLERRARMPLINLSIV